MAAVLLNRCTTCKVKEILTKAFSGEKGGVICQECKETENRIGKFLSEYNFVESAK